MLKTRRHFTILEVLIVIFLITLISGVVAIGINRILKKQRFQSEVAQVVTTLRTAQDLMLIVQDDVFVKFTSDKGISMKLDTESSSAKNWERQLRRMDKTFSTINSFSFKDAKTGALNKNDVDLQFFSDGFVMSQGTLHLSSGELKSTICLHGYPAPINSITGEKKCTFMNPQDNQLTELTVREIRREDDETEE